MAAEGQVVTVTTSPTLIFQVLDEPSYAALVSPAENIFQAGTTGDPLPLLLVFPSAVNLFLGGSDVAASGGLVGANINGVTSLSYNCVANDSLYGIVATATQPVQLLVLRQ
jgi:hypothetical protein